MLVVLGNQLFSPEYLPPPGTAPVFMAEDLGLCTYVRHHQQKIVLFLSAMRAYADELDAAGYQVTYHRLDPSCDDSYEDKLLAAMRAHESTALQHFEIEDKPMENRLVAFARDHGFDRDELESPIIARSFPVTCSHQICRGRQPANTTTMSSTSCAATSMITPAMLGSSSGQRPGSKRRSG